MDSATVQELASSLLDAERKRRPIPPLTREHPEMTTGDAYRIQQEIVLARLDEGEEIIGWKVGLTSQAMQEMLGVAEPDYGPILSSMLVRNGGVIAYELIQPKVEAEIAFVLQRPLKGPGLTPSDVVHATAGVMAAIEVIDSRFEDWRITLPDTIADLASSARVVTSGQPVPIDAIDLRRIAATMSVNDNDVETGVGAAVLGNPLNAVAWAANTLGELGNTLEPGHIVMPGALHRAVDVSPGDIVFATFDRLGPVSASFGA